METPFLNIGMLENLVSEGIGIVVTVFIVDQLIKYRENKRLKPAIDIFHGKLFRLLTKLIDAVSYLDSKPEEHYFFYFNTICVSSFSYEKVASFHISKSIRPKIESGSLDLNKIKAIHKSFIVLIDNVSLFIDPTLLGEVVELEHKLDESLYDFEDLKNFDNELIFSGVLEKAIDIHRMLEKTAIKTKSLINPNS